MTNKKPTFEDNLDELTQLVNELEQGDVPLETALTKFQKGVKLSRALEQKLTQAEDTLTKVVNEQGELTNLDKKALDNQSQDQSLESHDDK